MNAELEVIERNRLRTKSDITLGRTIVKARDLLGKNPTELSQNEKTLIESARVALKKIVTNNRGLVVFHAKKLQGNSNFGVPLEDLTQRGMESLTRVALQKYDPEMGLPICNLASWHIQKSMRDESASQGGNMSIPYEVNQQILRLSATTTRLKAEGKQADIETLAKELDLPQDKVRQLVEIKKTNCRNPLPKTQRQPDNTRKAMDHADEAIDFRKTIETITTVCSEKQQRAIFLRTGIEPGSKEMTFAEVGAEMGVCWKVARDHYNRGIERYRRYLETGEIVSSGRPKKTSNQWDCT